MIDWNTFFDVRRDVTIWEILDSQFLTTVLLVFVTVGIAFYEKKARKAEQEAAAIGEVLNSFLEARNREAHAELALPEDPPPLQIGERDYREDAQETVAVAKQYLEELVAKDPDGRHHRTYEKIPRYDYTVLAVALRERDRITEAQADAAANIFAEWNRYSKGRAARLAVPRVVLDFLDRQYTRLTENNEL